MNCERWWRHSVDEYCRQSLHCLSFNISVLQLLLGSTVSARKSNPITPPYNLNLEVPSALRLCLLAHPFEKYLTTIKSTLSFFMKAHFCMVKCSLQRTMRQPRLRACQSCGGFKEHCIRDATTSRVRYNTASRTTLKYI